MGAIIVEGVLFVAMIAAGGALLYWVIMRAAELVCAIHGRRTEDQLVRLASGEQVCPDCYKEIINA